MFGVEPLARIVRHDARIEVKVPAAQGRKAYSYFREGGEGEKKSSGVGKKVALIGGGLALAGLGAAAIAMSRKGFDSIFEDFKRDFNPDFGAAGNRSSKSPYSDPWNQALGVSKTASRKDIKSAYLKKAQKTHPDLVSDPEEKRKRTESMKKLNDAMEKALKEVPE